jgi:hypothetical protein
VRLDLNIPSPYFPNWVPQKFYFAALLYSFAHHLRRGSYRSLPLSRTNTNGTGMPFAKDSFSALPDLDADTADDGIDTNVDLSALYGTPPPLPVHNIPSPSRHRSSRSTPGSVGSFADFVSAPPPRRARRTRGSLLAGGSTRTASNTSGSAAGSSSTGPSEGEDDELSSVGTGTSRTRT